MELEDPHVLKEYVTYACNLFPPTFRPDPDKKLISTFIRFRSSEEKFPVSLTEFARMLWPEAKGKTLQDRRTQIGALMFPRKGDRYQQDVDYKKETDEIYLSARCFTDVCQRMRSDRTRILTMYLSIAEEALRDFMGETIKTRRMQESPGISRKKEIQKEYFDLPRKPLFYWDHFQQTDPSTGELSETDRFGVTNTGNTRIQTHKHTYPGDHEVKKYHVMKTPWQAFAVEGTLKALRQEPSYRPDLAWQVAIEAGEWGERRYQELMQQSTR
jgi:hypothetical protein